MTGDDPIATGQAVKRTEALLRDARAVLRRVDVLLDPALPEIAALRGACDRLVAQLGWQAPQLAACRRWRTVAAIFRFAC